MWSMLGMCSQGAWSRNGGDGVRWHRTGGAAAGGWSGLHMDAPVMGVLVHRDKSVTREVGMERVLQLPGVNCFSG